MCLPRSVALRLKNSPPLLALPPTKRGPAVLPKICAECGRQYETETTAALCTECRPAPRLGPSIRIERDRARARNTPGTRRAPRRMGYDTRWDRLSRRARRLQPWCSDCGTPHDLTADHTTSAWARKEQGLEIRLEDIDVVCRACNADRGPARGPDASDSKRQLQRDEQLRATAYGDDDEIGLDEAIARGLVEPD